MKITTALTMGLALVLPLGSAAQENGAAEVVIPAVAPVYEVDPQAAAVPFGPGEYLEYGVKVGAFGVGGGYMSVDTIETVQGFPTYRLHMKLQGSALFGAVKMNDDYRSWMDIESLMSRRYIKDQNQKNYTRRKHYELYPEELWWEVVGESASGDLASALPLDEISFVYFLRTLDLEVGETIELNRYFKEAGNPVRIEVLRRDTRTTDAGTFKTIVVRPVIPGANLFDTDSKAEIHLSDDDNRYVVYMKSNLGFLGVSVSLSLRSVVPGQSIHGERADKQ